MYEATEELWIDGEKKIGCGEQARRLLCGESRVMRLSHRWREYEEGAMAVGRMGSKNEEIYYGGRIGHGEKTRQCEVRLDLAVG
jgi:hypothetical protein